MQQDTFNQVYFQFISDIQRDAFEITKEYQPEGITQLEYSILEYLYFFKGKYFSDLCKDLYMSTSQGRRVVKNLTERHYLESVKDDIDGRKKVYHITRKGKAKLDACYFQVMKGVHDKYESLGEEALKNLIECMNYITKTMYKQL